MGVVIAAVNGGLCNKLRAVFSYYLLAKEKNEILIAVWTSDSGCPGFFLDYFYPVEGIIFVKNSNDKRIKQYKHSFNVRTGAIHKDYLPSYKYLKPLPRISNVIKKKIETLENNYIAVHIRRTDHIKLAKRKNRYTSDEHFFDFIKSNQGDKNIYIATDNKQTYDLFVKKIKGVKFPYHENVNKNALRHTTLGDAIIDLYMCVHANDFMGSGWSSFSGIIKNIRNQKAQIKWEN